MAMNQVSQVVTTLEHYKVVVRDTLEYCLNKEAYDPNLFKEKQRSILVEVDQTTPLKNIITNSGENGEKLEKLIRDFHEKVYGENSTILKLAVDASGKEEVRVDHAQHLAIYEGVLPIHENVEAMVRGILLDAKKNGLDVKAVEECDLAEERLFRGVAFMTLVSDLVKLFGDYNQARREANGEENASSRFIGNDINAVVTHINQTRAASRLTDLKYKAMEDAINALVENMTGRRDLPEGKTFNDVITSTQKTIADYVREVEPVFRDKYVPLITELVSSAQANNGQITPDTPKA